MRMIAHLIELVLIAAASWLCACTSRSQPAATPAPTGACEYGGMATVSNRLPEDIDVIAYDAHGNRRPLGTVSPGATVTFTLSDEGTRYLRWEQAFTGLRQPARAALGDPKTMVRIELRCNKSA